MEARVDASCRGRPSRHVVVSFSRSSLTPAEPWGVRKVGDSCTLAALSMPWCRNSKWRHPLPTTTKHYDLSLALIGDRVPGGVTRLNRVHDMWEAPIRRGCGCGRSDGICSSHSEASSPGAQRPAPNALALVVIAEQGTPLRATGRQAPGIHAVSL